MTAFPSLTITPDGFRSNGIFAEAQAAFLNPDPQTVKEVDDLLSSKRLGVVAHFYMDPELQGVLAACKKTPVHISDSLVMADRAVDMAKNGAQGIAVLGVDFMAENARAMLDASGFEHIPVYRLAEETIGCSLASAAESLAYSAYLHRAKKTPRALHVVYINTSLKTKAEAQHLVPTITCTSSNVVRTVLTAFAQVEGVEVFFGPDTYMGRNLQKLFQQLSTMSDEAVQKVHPAHTAKSIAALLERFHIFEQGNCIVHHLFGDEVTNTIARDYGDAFLSAHFEVPGAMFDLALQAQRDDRGVVGSTADILSFIDRKVREGIASKTKARILLGTEAGMITSIVRRVQKLFVELQAPKDAACEIIFPVAADSISTTHESDLAIVPGPMGGEGCSVEGGCATCPYMKMNSLDALIDLAKGLGARDLSGFYPHPWSGNSKLLGDAPALSVSDMSDLGTIPILNMRTFQSQGSLGVELVNDILSR